MNRELAEVRRYWPRAKYDPSCLYQYTAAGGLIGLMILGGAAEIARAVGQKWIRCRGSTIPEAMRAAGFGVRPEYATRGYHFAAYRAKKVRSREQIRLLRAGCGWNPAWLIREYERFDRLPALVSTQRPCKGARLGRRKREVQP